MKKQVKIGYSFCGTFYKDKADCPITDPIPVYITDRRNKKRSK